MSVQPVKLPTDLPSFLSGMNEADILRAEEILNAIQSMRIQLTVNGVPHVGVIQITKDSAVIVVNL